MCRAWIVCETVSSIPTSEATTSAPIAASPSGVAPKSGLVAVMGWIAVQVSAKSGFRSRTSARSWKRRIVSPSAVVSSRASTARTRASTIRLPRALAIRNMSDGTPSCGVTTALWLKTTRAVGRENLANTSPVTMASPRTPVITSTVTSRFDHTVPGASRP